MDVKTAGTVSEKRQIPVYDRARRGPVKVNCSHWLARRCTRDPCLRNPNDSAKKLRNPNNNAKKPRKSNNIDKLCNLPSVEYGSEHKSSGKAQQKVCQYWLSDNCVHGEKCQDLHSWFCGDGFSMLGKLEGHNKAVTGIALPFGSDKLYSGSKDKTVRIWDCHSAQCVHVVTLSGEVGSLISDGPWIFVGLPNSVRAWNSQTFDDLTLTGPVGQVCAMVVGNDILFAGTEDGTILAWKLASQTNCLALVDSLEGHSDGVISLCVGDCNKLYSGSVDNTIRVWDLNTLKCMQTLKGHTDAVMSVICVDRYLLSCSLDGTIKAWADIKLGDIKVIHTHEEDHGVLALSGITDTEGKHILLCSRSDNSVRLYDLPLFIERGRLFAIREVRSMETSPTGHFFTGDATGQLTVWKLAGESSAVASSSSECKSAEKAEQKVCPYWLSDNCEHGEKCPYLHSWFCGNGFSMLAKLEGHSKAVTGIAFPFGSDKLYSGSKDKTMRIWDFNSGQCVQVVSLAAKVGSLISEGPWIFVGLPNSIMAWNSQTLDDLTLTGPVGQVRAMVVGNDTFFAGTEGGTILAWKSSSKTNCPELAALLEGHGDGVISLCVGACNRLYSGSMDNTIRVWDLNTFKCIQTLKGHTGAVMSVICWDRYLLSCSLDGTIKAWGDNEVGDIEVMHTREEGHGVFALSGITVAEGKHILLCSYKDNSVRLYYLPSFTERGRLFAKREVRSMGIGPAGHFFTGDATGQLIVWKLEGESSAAASLTS